MADSQEVVRREYANQELFATGDGRTRLFPLRIGDHEITPTVVDAIQINDWQGHPSLARPQARTNILTYSTGYTEARGWYSMFGAPHSLEPTQNGPDQFTGKVESIRLGDCNGDVSGTLGGIANLDPKVIARMNAGDNYIASMWVRATVPMSARITSATVGYGEPVSVGTTWTRLSSLGTVPTGGSARPMALLLDRADNPGVGDNEKLMFTYAQLGSQIMVNDPTPSRYIETNGSIVTVVDYVINDGNVIFSVPLLDKATATWTGSGYWVDTQAANIVSAFDLKRGMTWRLDQSPKLNSILDSKINWYNVNFVNFWQNWYSSVFRLKSANSFGIAVWAYILGLPLSILGLQEAYRYWGYGPLRGNYRNSWDDTVDQPSSGNFPPSDSSGGGGAISTDWEKIASLRLRYYALTSSATITEINSMLQDVFNEVGLAYVIDNQNMTATYYFDFPISLSFQNAMLQYGLLPKPAGVKLILQTP